MRHKNDYYLTPAWCYEKLPIDWALFENAHEPCAGDGRIVRFLEKQGLATTWTEISEGTDYLAWNGSADLILTNPPFSLAQEFIVHSLNRANTVIMLLRINFLGSQKRHDWWKAHKPSTMFVLSKRPSFTGKGTDSIDYAWFVWDKTNRVPAGLDFLK